MYNILVLNKISRHGLERLHEDKYICSDSIKDPDGIILRSADLKSEPLPESVLAIARAGAGVNNIPVDWCTEHGIPVFNTPGANANAVKELVIGAMLMAARNIPDAMEWMKSVADKGDEIPNLVEKGKGQFVGPELAGKTLGVIGLGAIGVQVANAAVALGMSVYGYDPFISVDAAWGLSRSVHHSMDVAELYKNSDYITIHVPLTNDTKNFINSESIARMKNGVRVFNFARGGLVNSADIAAAVEGGKVACYATDFSDSTLVGRAHIISIPHLGASTPESEENCATMASREIAHFLERGSVENSVNFPNCELAKPAAYRVTLVNRNVPGMLSAITSLASDCGYNIDNLINKSFKGSVAAYTVIDLTEKPHEDFLKRLSDIDGIIRVRVID